MMRAVARLSAEEELGWYGAMRADADGTLALPGQATAAGGAEWRRIWESTRPLEGRPRRRVWTW
jgi:1-acyl-sn-glycerol-3-phosphate acyltransferase